MRVRSARSKKMDLSFSAADFLIELLDFFIKMELIFCANKRTQVKDVR